ncbi:MAG: effector-associated domain 2-containing protein [Actinoallomurus sp.]
MQTDSDAGHARPSGFRTIFVCDIVGFGQRQGKDRVQEHLRATLYAALKNAFDAAGMRFADCYHEDRGDGVMIVLPEKVDSALLVHPLADHLRGEIRRANELASESATMRLRVAVHCGRMGSDANGLVGTTVNHVFRLLDAPGFKQAMEGSTTAVGLLASDEFYAAVIQEGRGAIDPAEFSPIEVRVKETVATAWIRVPGAASQTDARQVVPQPPPPVDHVAQGPRDGAAHGHEARTPAPDLFEVVGRILDIPLMASAEGRDHAVSSLRQEIAIRIARRPQAHLDMHSIVRTCLDFPGGLEEFLAVVRAYAGDSSPMRALDETIARVRDGDG